jgi:hypothetical protein
MVTIERAKERLRAVRLRCVPAQGAEQQGQCGLDSGAGLPWFDAELPGNLLQRGALQLRIQLVGEIGHRSLLTASGPLS